MLNSIFLILSLVLGTAFAVDIPIYDERVHATYSITGSTITFNITAESTGYVALGFSNATGMVQADMFIAGVHPANGQYSLDAHSNGPPPIIDVQRNYDLLQARETQEETTIVFSRNLITNDPDDVPIEDKDMTIIWALGNTDEIMYHGNSNRGSINFNLIRTKELPIQDDRLKVAYILNSTHATFYAHSETTGYIGFGFSNSTGMNGADIFIGGVNNAGQSYSGDYHSIVPGPPIMDTVNNWVMGEFMEAHNETRFTFSRALNTGDSQDIAIENKVMNIIWSLGATDTIEYHGNNRGSFTFNLFTGQ